MLRPRRSDNNNLCLPFSESQSDMHPQEISALQGASLVMEVVHMFVQEAAVQRPVCPIEPRVMQVIEDYDCH